MNDLAVVLRRYGFLGDAGDALVVITDPEDAARGGLDVRREPAGRFTYDVRRFNFLPKRRQYRALFQHASFTGPDVVPIWTTADGRTVIGWWNKHGQRRLLVGVDLVEELVRYTQGDPAKVETARDKTMWGVGHERPAYLFEDHIVHGDEMAPWADRLGLLVARALSELTGVPLIAPLPNGAKGAILLTGDDDQAELAKYATQLRMLDGFPITYLLLPHTRHTAETIAALPAGVELGVHVDALDHPEQYDRVCAAQTAAVEKLIGRPVRTVRNHGHLNRGYWTQLAAWEQNRLSLDFNIRGIDGTCPTGSYLPFRVRRADGTWSDHWSVFSTFSDSMLALQHWPQSKQIQVIRALAASFSHAAPGIIVANFHPQNVDDIPDVHRALIRIGRQSGWQALGGDSFAQWLAAVDTVQMSVTAGTVRLTSEKPVTGMALHWPGRKSPAIVPPFCGSVDVSNPAGA